MKKIKTKLMFGILLVFIISYLIFMLNISSNHLVISKSESMLKDNYPSVKYSFSMLNDLDEINNLLVEINIGVSREAKIDSLLKDFKTKLTLQNSNITETGEEQLTKVMNVNFLDFEKSIYDELYISNYPTYREKYLNLRQYILNIFYLNTKLLEEKNIEIKKEAVKIVNIQKNVGIVGLTILCILLVVLPMFVINPIDKLTKRMMDFYKTNFKKEIFIESNHELEKLEELFEKVVMEVNKNKEDK
ncbi:MAG: hypothetical protein JXB49_03320 [Bacteroidales bacterium]|nr:hypothetical protein [Bacteroidales bacterium]